MKIQIREKMIATLSYSVSFPKQFLRTPCLLLIRTTQGTLILLLLNTDFTCNSCKQFKSSKFHLVLLSTNLTTKEDFKWINLIFSQAFFQWVYSNQIGSMATNSIIRLSFHVRIGSVIQKTSESFQQFITVISDTKVSTKTHILNTSAIQLKDSGMGVYFILYLTLKKSRNINSIIHFDTDIPIEIKIDKNSYS